jgi:enoyl-CoA hydratase
MSEEELVVARNGALGSIRLNRPQALNSLTLNMVRLFTQALEAFAADDAICAVLVTGAGERGLCAGGDIRDLYFSRGAADNPYKTFWREEYRLNARIAEFAKPYVVVMDGVVMGGGVGVSAHGSHRLVTERTRLAMPETGIGFIPDVGGTWLLTRRPGGAGTYMALAGAVVAAADVLHVGLADMVISSGDLQKIEAQLARIRTAADVDGTLAHFAQEPGASALEINKAILDATMDRERVEDVISALQASGDAFAKEAAAIIATRSPTSLELTHALLRRAAVADNLKACLTNEFRAACGLLQTHDLYEGVRAAIIDKDRTPRWEPATLAEVEDGAIAELLEGTGDAEPFGDERINLGAQ